MSALHQGMTRPPTAVIGLAVFVTGVSTSLLFTDKSHPITLEEAGGSLLLSARALCAIRAVFALGHMCLLAFMTTRPPISFKMVYKRELGSKLKDEIFELVGLERMYSFFTIWTYAAQGLYFALAALCSAALFNEHAAALMSPRLIHTTHLLYEMVAGCCFVVTTVVSFVIWPEKVREKEPHDLHEFYNLVMHNCNALETATELLFSRVPITPSHAPVGVLWGTAFVVFSWIHGPKLAKRAKVVGGSHGNGANFPYFFLDFTFPVKVQYACLLGLLAVMLIFYHGSRLFRWLVLRTAATSVPVWLRAGVTYALTLCLTKWRD